MRIAILCQSYPPMVSGAALTAQLLAQEQAKLGHQVLVITPSPEGKAYQTNTGNLEINYLPSFSNPFRVDQRFSHWPKRPVLRHLDKFSPDIIHIHDPFQPALIALSFKKRIPVMLTLQQLPWFIGATLPAINGLKLGLESLLWHYFGWIAKRCAAVITPTRTTAELVESKIGISVKAISNGVDLEIYRPRVNGGTKRKVLQKFGIPTDVPVILYAGRLDVDKKVHVVVEAAANAIRENGAHLLFVGDGTQKTKLIEKCRQLGIEQSCHFTGFVRDRTALSAIYRCANVFVSASEIETQGITFLEAAACGIPIVAVNASCVPEIVHDRVNGILVESGDMNRFGAAIQEIVADPDLALQMGLAGRRLAENHSVHETVKAYESLGLDVITLYS